MLSAWKSSVKAWGTPLSGATAGMTCVPACESWASSDESPLTFVVHDDEVWILRLYYGGRNWMA